MHRKIAVMLFRYFLDVNSLLACNWWENKIVKADRNQNQEYWEKKKNIWQEITDIQGTWIYVKVLKIDKNAPIC